MSHKKEKKTIQWKALLISFGITCLMLGAVIGLTIWYQTSVVTNAIVKWEWNTPSVWIGNGIAFLIMFAIIFHFVKKPKKKEPQENWNP